MREKGQTEVAKTLETPVFSRGIEILTEKRELVKELLLQATVYVYEDNQEILGFIGLNDEYIEGIFVSDEMQSFGIGKALLNYVKDKRSKLFLNVYQKNTRAISFYQREGFEVKNSGLDEATGEKEYVMAWQQKACLQAILN